MKTRSGRLAAFMLVPVLAAGCVAKSRVDGPVNWGLPYPPEAPRAEDIFHVPTGLRVSFDGALDLLSGARVVYVAETHDNLHAHRVQFLVIRELHRRFAGKVAIGMEMFRENQQESLDRWTKGELDELSFLKATKWYEGWGADFGYYRDILAFAKENGIDIVALNPPREVQDEVSRTGLDNVPEALAAKLPEIGPPDPYQRAALKEVYGAHLPSEGAFEAFFRVQLLWEETMAARIVEYLRSARGEGKRMVVLAGGWHVRYGFGIPKKVFRRTPLPYAIVEPVEIEIPEEKRDQLMDVDVPPTPLLSADLLWYVPYEDLEKERVRLGVRVAGKVDRVMIEKVEAGSPAETAGIPDGSEFVSFDGRPVADTTDLFYFVGGKKEGDVAEVVLRRDGVETAYRVTFFRMAPAKPAH